METCSARFGHCRILYSSRVTLRASQPATQFPNWLTKTASEGVLLQICNPTEKNYSPMPIQLEMFIRGMLSLPRIEVEE
jgi:hypothetical protein